MNFAIKNAVVWATACSAIAIASDPTLAQTVTPTFQDGSVVKPNAEVPIRDAAPGGFFQGLGKKIGKTDPNQKYVVLDQRQVLGLTGPQSWIRLQPTDGDGGGWAYAGSSINDSNFVTLGTR
jgi:hypothetical protein